jgi:RhtB (resistance to homoserine/threonine) family protein
MLTQFLTIGLLMLFSAMLPGPDFAMVTRNTIMHSRRAGLFTAFGVTAANLVHITYCVLGLALIISQSIILFSVIKYIGATYLIYLGITALMSRQNEAAATTSDNPKPKTTMSRLTAFRQGFFCNLLNPKATLFFLAFFTVIMKPETPRAWELILCVEMLVIIFLWFSSLALMLSHPRVVHGLHKIEKYISKALGIFLIGFGTLLAFVKN